MGDWFNWHSLLATLGKLVAAYVLTLPVAWERELADRSAGLRTFPLVAVASCGYMLFAFEMFVESPEAQARLIAGLVSGIGFIGGGAILKTKGTVHGTATAASIWNTGAIGTAVAYGRYEIAVLLSLVNYATLRLMKPLKAESGDGEA